MFSMLIRANPGSQACFQISYDIMKFEKATFSPEDSGDDSYGIYGDFTFTWSP